MKPEFMIDIETLATPEDLPSGYLVEVTEIAVVRFDSSGVMDGGEVFYPREGNGLCSAETARWWMSKPKPTWLDVRNDAESPEELASMADCLKYLSEYIGGYSSVIWTKGRFDIPILQGHYAANRMVCPWQYFNCRDLRTVMKECAVEPVRGATTHNALEDAAAQVELLLRCRETLKRVPA